MNRHSRRAVDAHVRTATGESPSAGTIALYLVGRMGQRGQEILADVRGALGREPTSGEIVDVLMSEATRFEGALLKKSFGDAVDAAVCVLFLARDLAIRQGKIVIDADPKKLD